MRTEGQGDRPVAHKETFELQSLEFWSELGCPVLGGFGLLDFLPQYNKFLQGCPGELPKLTLLLDGPVFLGPLWIATAAVSSLSCVALIPWEFTGVQAGLATTAQCSWHWCGVGERGFMGTSSLPAPTLFRHRGLRCCLPVCVRNRGDSGESYLMLLLLCQRDEVFILWEQILVLGSAGVVSPITCWAGRPPSG